MTTRKKGKKTVRTISGLGVLNSTWDGSWISMVEEHPDLGAEVDLADLLEYAGMKPNEAPRRFKITIEVEQS